MMDKFTRIAREGLIKDMMKKTGQKLTPVQERVSIEMNIRLSDRLTPWIQERNGRFGPEEIGQATFRFTFEILEDLKVLYREQNDWEAYGLVHYIQGKMS